MMGYGGGRPFMFFFFLCLVHDCHLDSPGHLPRTGLSPSEKRRIVDEHNRFRRTVTASNMRKMQWDPYLAASAQSHADRCRFEHSELSEVIGENLWAAQYIRTSVREAVRDWYDEVKNRSCSCATSDLFAECCGHYTQVMWADTNRLGCGYSICPRIVGAHGRHHMLVCHYSPPGNLVVQSSNGRTISLPVFRRVWNRESICSDCSNNCEDGLCL